MAHDYLNMDANAALALAKEEGDELYRRVNGRKLTNAAIANLTGIGAEAIQRYFNPYDDYGPGYKHISLLCRALGNTILFDWLKAQMADLLPTDARMDTAGKVARLAANIGAQSGRVCQVAVDTIEDGCVEPHEAAALDAELAHLDKHIQEAREGLRPVVLSGLTKKAGKRR